MVAQTIVLYPSNGISHLVPMVELGKFVLKHHPSFSITILITIPPFSSGSTNPYIENVSKTNPSINFHYLPTIPLSDISSHPSNKMAILLKHRLLNNPLIHTALETISTSSTIPAFIIDMFCCPSMEVAKKFNIPVYLFFTPNINVLSIFLYLPTLHENTTKSFREMKNPLEFPGVPPIHSSCMMGHLLDRSSEMYVSFIESCSQYRKTQGILVNSFESLEPRALKAITEGLCVPDGPTPPVYCIGPLLATNDSTGNESCLEWLDLQPKRSVVFLCFGSAGSFSEAQLMEIATGLEKSGQRFLWVVRAPTTDGRINLHSAPVEPDLDAILPDGFLERTKERGMVVKSWAPQIQVLSKESIGGFVTHCGWNSVLEALCAGVPLVAWPLYAEQRINRVVLVEELKLALSMEEGEGGFVRADEVEKRVRGLIESEEGRAIRDRAVKVSGEAKAAITKGGSSVRDLARLADLWKSVSG